MRPFLFFFLLFISLILLSTEKENDNKKINKTENKKPNKKEKTNNKTLDKSGNKLGNKTLQSPKNKTSNKMKNKKPENKKKKLHKPPFTNSSFTSNDSENITNRDIYSLNDITFDMVLQKGNNFKWLVILYSESCGHCEHARRELRKIFPHYKNSTSIRFAEIEINRNQMTNMRFNIEGVPYIFLLQNNSIYEMDLYPSQKNFKKFIETDFKDVQNELKPFPPMVEMYKFAWQIIKNIMNGITNGVNELLYDYGYEFEFTPLWLFLSVIMFFVSICFLEYFCCLRFCPDEEAQKDINKGKKNENENDNEEEKYEESDKENKNEKEDIDNQESNETTEEEKIKREKEKEEENNSKHNQKQKKDNKEIKDKKINKKRKKE